MKFNLEPSIKVLLIMVTLIFNITPKKFDAIFTLGDSLADGGTYAQATQIFVPKSGRFTINPGKTWGEDIASRFNLPDTINASGLDFNNQTILGGTNYAQGGARVSEISNFFGILIPKPIDIQLNQFLNDTKGTISKKTLILLTGGGNDILQEYSNNWQSGNQQAALNNLIIAGNELANVAARLETLCPKNLVLLKNGNIVLTPFGQTDKSAFEQMGRAFDSSLINGLSNVNALVIDPNIINAEVLREPSRFGFFKVDQLKDYALLHADFKTFVPFESSIFLVEGTNIIDGNKYVFADTIHPSALSHQILADTVLSIIRAPEQISALNISPMLTMRQYLENLETRLDNLINTDCGIRDRCACSFDIYGYYWHSQTKFNRLDFIGNKTKSNSGIIGIDYAITNDILLGIETNFTKAHTCFCNNLGNFSNKLVTGLAYAAIKLPCNFNFSFYAGSGRIRYNSIERNALVGNNTSVHAQAKACGHYTAGRGSLGYSFGHSCCNNNISLGLAFEKVSRNSFSETGDFIALNFNKTRFKALRFSLAWDFYYDNDCTNFRPFFRISLEQDLKKDPICIRYGMEKDHLTLAKIDRPQRTYANFNGGLNYIFNDNFDFTFDGNVHLGQKSIKSWSVFAGLNVIL